MPNGTDYTFGVVELRLSDYSWPLAEFSRILTGLDDSYRSFVALDAYLHEQFPLSDLQGYARFAYYRDYDPSWTMERLRSVAIEQTGPLSIFRLQIASPGVVEAVGGVESPQACGAFDLQLEA